MFFLPQRTTAGMLGQLPGDFKLRVECEREALHKLLHSAVRHSVAALRNPSPKSASRRALSALLIIHPSRPRSC